MAQLSNSPLLIVAEDVEPDALSALEAWTISGAVQTCAVRAPPGYIHEIAQFTSGEVFEGNLDMVMRGNLTSCSHVKVTADTTVFGTGEEEVHGVLYPAANHTKIGASFPLPVFGGPVNGDGLVGCDALVGISEGGVLHQTAGGPAGNNLDCAVSTGKADMSPPDRGTPATDMQQGKFIFYRLPPDSAPEAAPHADREALVLRIRCRNATIRAAALLAGQHRGGVVANAGLDLSDMPVWLERLVGAFDQDDRVTLLRQGLQTETAGAVTFAAPSTTLTAPLPTLPAYQQAMSRWRQKYHSSDF